MEETLHAVHVHSIDAGCVIEEYRAKGFVLSERTAPTIAAQPGFVKLIFIPADQVVDSKRKENRRFRLI